MAAEVLPASGKGEGGNGQAIAGTAVIVDDNPRNLQVLSSILDREGYKVRPALNGEMALRSITLAPPDVVLLDIRMPGMDGFEVCRRLKADPRTREVPVIFISALHDTEDKLTAFQVGGVDYVAKPFQMEEVLARVRAHVQLYRMQRHLEELVQERTAELQQANDSLRESEQQQRLTRFALDRLTDGILLLDDEGAFHYVNQGACERLGYAQETLLARHISDIAPDLDGVHWAAFLRDIHAAGFVTLESELRTQGGEAFPAKIRANSFEYEGQAYSLAFVHDISERKQAQAALAAAEARSRLLLESVGEGIFGVNKAGLITFINPAGASLLGYAPETLIGQSAHQAIHHSHRDGSPYPLEECPVHRSCTHAETQHEEEVLWRIDGTPLEVEYTSVPLQQNGQPDGVVVVFHDISERKHYEEQLHQALHRAEEASLAKGYFLANMSHEIRTPLNAIIGMTHLALHTELTPKQSGYLQKVNHSAQNLLGIVNDILDFSKIEAGKMEIEQVPFRIETVLGEIADEVGLKAQEKGLEFLVSVEPGMPVELIGDPLRLSQILLNLANNAVKFTRDGEVVVTVRELASRDQRIKLEFCVRDTGIGIAPAQQLQLFEAFSQADSSITREFGGTGLGLAICKRLTEMMGGKISLLSRPGQGSEFKFTIWLGRAEHQDAGPRLPPELCRRRVLVVDENPTAREILCRQLTAFGLLAEGVASRGDAVSQVAIAARAGAPFHLMLVDQRITGPRGTHTRWQMRTDDDVPSVPAIVMVPSFEQGGGINLEDPENGYVGYLVKPVGASQLYPAILKAFGLGEPLPPGAGKRPDDALAVGRGLAGMEILLVEDNDLNQELARELLEQVGARVSVAGNGREALEQLRQSPFDLVLMDLQMPVMDGLSATRAIREQREWDRLPVIAMTAEAMAGDREKCLAVGMNDYISKPIDPAQMFATIVRWARPAGAGGEEAVPAVPAPAPVAAAQAASLPPLVGIDQAAGLTVTQGDVDLYRRLLRKFRDGQRGFAEAFRRALEDAADPQAAIRAAHSLKGVAANIGAQGVRQAAAALEEACKRGHSRGEIDARLSATLDVLTPVIAALDGLERGAPADATALGLAALPSTAQWAPLVERLRPLLVANDLAALPAVAELAWALQGTILEAIAQRLAEAVADLDFEVALRELATLEATSTAAP
jgi:two-component system, sensor histidine kinase and response regulator